MILSIRRLIRQRRHENESFKARIEMEKQAQIETAAKLTRLELSYKNKARIP